MNPTNFYQVIGNPNLEPEYANSLQIGGEYATPGRRARFGVNVFRNDVNDLIESVSLGMVVTQAQLDALLAREGLDPTLRPTLGRLLFTYKNINDAVTEGVEVDGDVAVLRNLSLGGAYTYLDARDDDTGLKLTGRHQHQGNIRLAWQLDRTGTRATFRGMFYGDWIAARATTATGVEDTIAPGFALWDLFVSQRVVRGINAFVAVDNLFDNQDPNTGVLTATGSPASIYRPEAGRTARFGVRWVWTR
jgi:outer membrane receptor for ferrienterochelin and colicins